VISHVILKFSVNIRSKKKPHRWGLKYHKIKLAPKSEFGKIKKIVGII
jgi:hypothetical protein